MIKLRDLNEIYGASLTHSQIAHTYAVCLATVDNTVSAYINKGIHEITTYHINPNSANALRKSDGRTEAQIIQLACSEPPQGHARWTLELLEDKARIVLDTPVSRETIRRTLKKMNLDLTAMNTDAFPQKKMLNL